MGKGRLEAFSDGVIAIIITIMVLELRAPQGTDIGALMEIAPTFIGYVLSFVFVAIYWNNHHHMLHASQQVNGRVLWANVHLLFWLSLVPFATAWLTKSGFASVPMAAYGVVLWVSGLAYFLLARALVAHHGENSVLGRAIGSDRKGLASLVVYTVAIVCAFIQPWLAFALYVVVAVMWFVPDRRIEANLK